MDSWRDPNVARLSRLLILGVVVLLAAATWATWGTVQIDSGREMYVPAELSQGKVLYRDLWYPYGPLAPYLNSLLFRLFGIHLNVLYAAGIVCTASILLMMHAIGSRFLPPAGALAVVGFASQVFQPSIFNYVLPYSSAALYSLAALLAMILVLLRGGTGVDGLFWGGILAGIAAVTKFEGGAACWLTLVLVLLIRTWHGRSRNLFLRDTVALLPGVVLMTSVLGWLVYRHGMEFLHQENWQSLPGSYFLKVYGDLWVRMVGFRTTAKGVLKQVISLIIFAGFWGAFSYMVSRLPRLLTLVLSGVVIAATAYLVWVPLPLKNRILALTPQFVIRSMVFTPGMSLLAVAVLALALAGCLKDRRRWEALAILAAAAVFHGIRVFENVLVSEYSIFYTPPGFLLMLVVLGYIVQRSGARSLNAPAVVLAFLLQTGLHALISSPYYRNPPSIPLQSGRGMIKVQEADAETYRAILSELEEMGKRGQSALLLPEATGLYFLSKMACPSRYYVLTPGVLAPAYTRSYLNGLERDLPDRIYLFNRGTSEYGVPWFGLDYDQPVMRWIESRYKITGQVGHFRRGAGGPVAALVYEPLTEVAR